MFGYLLDYAKTNSVAIDIYASPDHNLGWTEFYKNFFGQFTLNDPGQFDYEHLEKYDLIFLLTDDDPHFLTEKITQKHLIKKIVCVDHYVRLRNKNLTTHLGTRFYLGRSQIPWALPCFEYITLEDKKKKISTSVSINVGMIGGTFQGEESVVARLIEHNPDIVIHYVNREKPPGAVMNGIKVKQHIMASASDLLNVFSTCQYMLVNKIFRSRFTFDSLSTSVWLSYTTGCQLIMPISMKKAYKLNSPIGYWPFQKIKLDRNPDFSKVIAERSLLKKRLTDTIERFLKN